ncbi:MAG: ATP-binding cassette domain-containing protein [bacterium]|nr:ATP-binding cassette domain-containing protein [bacterium]
MLLSINNLHKSFGETEVLHGISFDVQSGKALGLLGRNGAGKTTTIRILMDVFKANSGTITIDGKPFEPKQFQIGYLPEERGLYPKRTVMEQIIYLAGLRGVGKKRAKENAEKYLARLGVAEYANKKLETLSKGNQQKIQLAQTIVCNPEIIILDEPFSGLDPVNSQILKDVILELIAAGRVVIFSSHQMGYVEEFCDDIVIINKGNVVIKGNLKEIKQEFGKNQLAVSAVNYTAEELARKCRNEFATLVTVTEEKKEYIIIRLQERVTKKDVLQAFVSSDIDIARFGIYEPSLTDIFVQKAGD